MAIELDPEIIYSVGFDLARISNVENREYDLVIDIESRVKAVYRLTLENLAKIAIGNDVVEWKPEGKLPIELHDRRVDEIAILKSGHIQVILKDGIIESSPHEKYESWNLCSPEKQFVCLPGGDLSVFNSG